VGVNVPKVDAVKFLARYTALHAAIKKGLVAAAHGIYRGGLGVHLAMMAMAGDLGLTIDLDAVPSDSGMRADKILFSESAGRMLAAVVPEHAAEFETIFAGLPLACIGTVTEKPMLEILAKKTKPLARVPVSKLRTAWKKPFGGLI
jgi:phosphoribosylformylglycinamidine synthase